jgi:hypothetical protein
MNDDSAGLSKVNVRITQNTYAWSTPGDRKYIMFRYTLKNPSNLPLVNVYAGIFADWDIQLSSKNSAAFDATTRMGYCYYTGATPIYAGTKLLSNTPAICHSIDNIQGGAGGVDPTDGYSAAEKFTSLSTDRYMAGTSGSGGDVIQVVSSGPFTILPFDSVTVAFAMLAGDNFADLQNSAENAQAKYDSVFPVSVMEKQLAKFMIYPNPVANNGSVVLTGLERGALVQLCDGTGRMIRSFSTNQDTEAPVNMDVKGLAAGTYYLSIRSKHRSGTVKLIVVPD